MIAFEVGIGESEKVADLFKNAGYRVSIKKDLNNIERLVAGIKEN